MAKLLSYKQDCSFSLSCLEVLKYTHICLHDYHQVNLLKSNKGNNPKVQPIKTHLINMSTNQIAFYRYTKGNVDIPFAIQSCCKPLNYALCVNDMGPENVHRYVGQEPSGELFNMIKLDPASK